MFNNIASETLEQIYSYAEQKYPEECCGFILETEGEVTFYKASNISETPQSSFAIDPRDYSKAEDSGNIIAIVHSHCNSNANPSEADKVSCESSQLPWLIVSYPSKDNKILQPTGLEWPYEKRPFFHGVLDCYSLVRDYYKRELDIDLPNYFRQDNWWHKDKNMYMDNAKDAGFEIIPTTSGPPKLHDLIVIQTGAEVPSHGAVYLGDGIMLHHMAGRKSCRAPYGGYWKKNTWAYLRHKELKI